MWGFVLLASTIIKLVCALAIGLFSYAFALVMHFLLRPISFSGSLVSMLIYLSYR